VRANAVARLEARLSELAGAPVGLERPNDPEHGDYATNVAMQLAPVRKRSPRELGEELAAAALGLVEVEQAEVFQALLPPGTPHDPLGHSINSVHQHDLSPGSGSFDGVFGVTLNSRWDRWLFNAQFQYFLRTEGESSFQYGDDLLISGGPGRYLFSKDNQSVSLQCIATYETMARDRLLGQTSDRTGSSIWYVGPQINLTAGSHFSANVGADFPVHITENGFQAVPDYRIRGGISWRF
jgi:hypothetical protein